VVHTDRVTQPDMREINRTVVERFRSGGELPHGMHHERLVLLTTRGQRTGREHTTPMMFHADDDRLLVIASNAGATRHPDWYHNLVADPAVTVETGLFTYPATAVVLRDAERDEVFARLVEADSGWGDYQTRTTRTIPVVALVPQPGPPTGGRGSFADALKLIHTAFRRELALIRKEVATSGAAGLGAQLRVNCLTVCQGLHYHHTGESGGLFPAVLEQHPELSDEIAVLQSEHDQIAVHLAELEKLVAGPEPDLLPEVDRIVTLLNAHLDREEAALLPFL